MRFNKQTAPFELRVKWRHFQKFRECQSDFADEIVTNKRENIKPNIFQSSIIIIIIINAKKKKNKYFPSRPSVDDLYTDDEGREKGNVDAERKCNSISYKSKAN